MPDRNRAQDAVIAMRATGEQTWHLMAKAIEAGWAPQGWVDDVVREFDYQHPRIEATNGGRYAMLTCGCLKTLYDNVRDPELQDAVECERHGRVGVIALTQQGWPRMWVAPKFYDNDDLGWWPEEEGDF